MASWGEGRTLTLLRVSDGDARPEAAPPPGESPPPGPEAPPRGRRARAWPWVGAGLVAFGVPLVVALLALRSPAWYPVLDRAGFELRLRDVGTADTPLVGVIARLGVGTEQGSHPGPLSFYLMWPAYRLCGASAWAMQVATAQVHILALVAALWIGARRGGPPLVAGLVVAAALLARGVGVATLLDPWNPFLSLLWWLAFLLAVWSAIDGDLRVLPVGALAGSICAQNHVEYLPLVAGLGGLGAAGLALHRWRARRADPTGRERGWAWLAWPAGAVGLAALLWVPPLLDQVTQAPGNLALLRNELGSGPEPAVGLWSGTRALLVNADPTRLVRGTVVGNYQNVGPFVPGLVMLAAWAGAAMVSRRLGHRSLVRLHLVVGAGFVVGAVTMSRITGPIWYWLGLWAAVLSLLAVLATAWTGLCLASRLAQARRPGGAGAAEALATTEFAATGPATTATPRAAGPPGRAHPPRLPAAHARRATWGLAVIAAALVPVLTVEATGAEPEGGALSPVLAAVVPPTVEALAAGDVPGGGRDGRYLVDATDPVHLGMHVFGLVNELDRAGFSAYMEPRYQASVTDHRVIDPAEATALVHLSVGPDIERWRDLPGVHEVAYIDDRSPAERQEYARLRHHLVSGLRDAGFPHLVPQVDVALTVIAIDPEVPQELRDTTERLITIGLPTAVFVAPPGTRPPVEG